MVESDGELPPLDVQDPRLVEVLGKLLGCQGRGHDDDPQLV